ncbi:hypothetical protein ACXR6G_05170 [Ancylomarina sp. YFZ004]
MAFNNFGLIARNRVTQITFEYNDFDPFDGIRFREWHQNYARIGFNKNIIEYIRIRDRVLHENTYWIRCPYCNWYYDMSSKRFHIDHKVSWQDYCLSLVNNQNNIGNLRAWEVYIGCNDPSNLIVSCASCNESKGDRNITDDWLNRRRMLASQTNGFNQ